nr:MAG TPA: hypothetical protein [Caudoviricetes sp.]
MSNEISPHSRSGHAHALEFITPVRLCSPLDLTSARLAVMLRYRCPFIY